MCVRSRRDEGELRARWSRTSHGLVLAGCGGSADPEDGGDAASTTTSGPVITVGDSEFGPMLFDDRGQAIHLFDQEDAGTPVCYDECEQAWPPVLTDGAPQPAGEAQAGLLGTSQRSDGSLQVTYAGHPPYFYANEDPGEVLCHDVFLNGWDLVRGHPGGQPRTHLSGLPGGGAGNIGAVCTVVVRWSAGGPAQILALRDELAGREFDDPGPWWPEVPDAVGGRDRVAGGTWCATRVGTGATAMVLNRPPKRIADPGAPSRGVLPLLALAHEEKWVSQVDVGGMASFALVLATPERLTTWEFDGEALVATDLAGDLHMITSGGPEDRKADRYRPAFERGSFPDGWRAVVQGETPQDDPGALVVRHVQEDLVFGTVFGQLIEAAPGRLRLEYSREPWSARPWRTLDG